MTWDVEETVPGWAREVSARLTAATQLVLAGNVDDVHLAPSAPGSEELVFKSTAQVVHDRLVEAGYTVVLYWNILVGVTTLYEARAGDAADTVGTQTWARRDKVDDPTVLADVVRGVVRKHGVRAAIIIDGAPRSADGHLHKLYAESRQLCIDTPPSPEVTDRRKGLRNLVVWMVSRESELPYWLLAAPGVRVVSLQKPTMEARLQAARLLVTSLPGAEELPDKEREEAVETLADHTEGMLLSDIRAATLIALDRAIEPPDIADAVRYLRAGVQASPWREHAVRQRIERSGDELNTIVFGQQHAVRKAVSALARAAIGLSGAHSAGHPNRPRGVLFFAGPTGVGKTELAKQMAKAVFGRAEAVARFDMSEYSAEHSEARLLGAPPGFIGHDSGGELTNAVRRRPFSLLLFDEIDKAHPRILDKFLQILEDGRLTDSAGSTVYFTDTFIVFTSNLGVYRQVDNGPVTPIIEPGTEYAAVEDRVRSAVQEHFSAIKRPELLNRIGLDNIVVFDFISPEAARQILRTSLQSVEQRVLRETGIALTVGSRAVAALEALIMLPENRAFGGRAVGALVSSHLVSPLSSELLTRRDRVPQEVVDIRVTREGPKIKLAERVSSP